MADKTSTLQELGINGGRPSFPYDVTAQLNAMSLYDTCEGLDSYLDLARELILSNRYFYQGIPFPIIPEGAVTNIAPFATISGTITIPPYSFVVSITHYSAQPEGFKISIYDKGAKTDLFYNKFAKDVTASSPMGFGDPHPATISTEALDVFNAQGPRFMTSPLIVLPPGTFQIEITNLSPLDNLVQVLFNFAVPFSGKATNIVSIGK